MEKIIRNSLFVIVILFITSILLSFTQLTFWESIRIIFGLVFVLFLPGFVIVSLFFKEVDTIEKIALSFALSIAIVPLTIFYLNKIGIRINTINSLLTILAIIAITIILRKFVKPKPLKTSTSFKSNNKSTKHLKNIKTKEKYKWNTKTTS